MVLGVDVGGTFTDAVLAGPGVLVTAKAPTTPDDQSRGVLQAIADVLRLAGARPADVTAFGHGMTVATNALLEDRGARTAFVATEGFTDVVALGRQARRDLYRLCAAHPAPICPPERRFPAPERLTVDGILRPLTADDATAVADAVAGCAPQAVAVCLLHAWRDPVHELALGRALRERLGPGVHVSLSHEVVGTFREFERAATTEIDAALSPLLSAYLERLIAGTRAAGLPLPDVMQSSGGLIEAATAARHAALTVLSGPAAGAAAAALVAEACGEPDLVCFDMGGTSCDVSVVEAGQVRETAGAAVAGRPVALPMVDIHTVGAGGGSIAWRDAGGALRVGPRSAGAVPGPAAYGRGGREPTVTDAHVVLGRLRADAPLAGIVLDVAAAHAAVALLAGDLGLDPQACARGILDVANAEMTRALRVMTVERGIDPRGFALLAFGGAGPLHAAEIAAALGMRRILVPRASGVLSALGLAAADRRMTRQRSVLLRGASLSDQRLAAEVRALEADARAALGAPQAPVRTVAETRFAGQSHELAVPLAPDVGVAGLRAAFAALHERRNGWSDPGAPIELVTLRASAVVPGPRLALTGTAGETAIAGPTVLHLPQTTVVVPQGWHGAADATGTLVLERTA